jgi:hypothetical protein
MSEPGDPWVLYDRYLSKTGNGKPIWFADPYGDYERIELGDVINMRYGGIQTMQEIMLLM